MIITLMIQTEFHIFKMIESVDDLMVILQEHSEEKTDDKTIINLIYKGNQLSG